ncbi:APC family permease [Neobacillus sp. 179-C4.2 HS]|jgi:putrescine importer|uniref:APC family permease n=1 Tax=Neobacillus driksii TaxID=3035913 RepID=A0ABV4YVF8_9BACI|nr:APC family permease [Neobacillus sp. 179.-C4.2 HS]MDP5192675.1 APC family permease [Neobacillus sp. 179.-C4.2 HS]
MEDVKLKRSLTVFPLVLFGLAYMAPTTVFSTYGVVAEITKGMVPAAYIIALIGMLFTAYSYGQMVKAYPVAGSAYTYTQKAINPHIGFLVGWVILLDYLFLPMINGLLIAIYLNAYFPSVPFSIWLIGFLILITTVNVIGVKIATKINLLLVACQFLIITIFTFLSIKGLLNGMGSGTLFMSSPFVNGDIPLSLVLAGSSILCLSFLGFDSVTTFSEETINPKKIIPKAIFLVALIGGGLFIAIAYLSHLVYPNFQSFKDPDSAALEIAIYIGGNLFQSIFLAGYITGGLASGLSSHASVSRLLYAMGRDGVLPKRIFGHLHPKFRTPTYNIFLVSIFALSALFVDLVTASSFINFGALVAFTFVNFSVISHYFIREKQRNGINTLKYLILPLIGVSFTIWLWTSLDSKALLLGLGWFGIGIVILLSTTKMFSKRPPELSIDSTEANEIQA